MKRNDGFVAVESQFIPRTFKDPNTGVTRANLRNPVLGGTSIGYVAFHSNYNNIISSTSMAFLPGKSTFTLKVRGLTQIYTD